MVQLKIVSGCGQEVVQEVEDFPCIIGRSPSAHLRIEARGVWERHLELSLNESGVFTLKTCPNALAFVNGKPSQEFFLRNGDLIEAGALKIQFWLSETRQRSLRAREALTWLGLGLLCAGQIGLVYWLMR
jgi:pSer/pThr/pTyr-binding forkhead associated (FHA) protein